MHSKEFNQLQVKIEGLYQKGKFSEALELISEQEVNYQQYQSVLDYWKATLYAGNGELDQALAILYEASQEGFWFSDALLKENPAFKTLLKKSEFQELILRNQELRESDPAGAFPIITMHPEGECMEGQSSCPLLLALHGNSSSARESLRFWKAAAANGWVVAAPQSTQAIWKDAYIWTDLRKTIEHIQQDYETLKQQYQIDTRRVIIAGQGSAADIAIHLILSGEIQALGFIAVEPVNLSIEDMREWIWQALKDIPNEVRGVIYISQESDSVKMNYLEKVAVFFNEMGINCRVETYSKEEGVIESENAESLSNVLSFLSA